jgi:hypothetical protein
MGRLEGFHCGLRLPSRIKSVIDTMGSREPGSHFCSERSGEGSLFLEEPVDTLQLGNTF